LKGDYPKNAFIGVCWPNCQWEEAGHNQGGGNFTGYSQCFGRDLPPCSNAVNDTLLWDKNVVCYKFTHLCSCYEGSFGENFLNVQCASNIAFIVTVPIIIIKILTGILTTIANEASLQLVKRKRPRQSSVNTTLMDKTEEQWHMRPLQEEEAGFCSKHFNKQCFKRLLRLDYSLENTTAVVVLYLLAAVCYSASYATLRTNAHDPGHLLACLAWFTLLWPINESVCILPCFILAMFGCSCCRGRSASEGLGAKLRLPHPSSGLLKSNDTAYASIRTTESRSISSHRDTRIQGFLD